MGSLVYGLLALIAQVTGFKRQISSLRADIGVTVLKPLYGTTPETYGCLESFCRQNHPNYQLLFGVADESDPAVQLIGRLRHTFPHRDIDLIVDRRLHGTSRKVSNLINLMAHARYDYLVLSDSDVRVPENYLTEVVTPLLAADVGIVTCTYRPGVPPRLARRAARQA